MLTEAPVEEKAGSSGGSIRPFTAEDAPIVASIVLRAFQHTDRTPPQGMVDYIREVYLQKPWYDPEIASRVFVRPNGRIIGFVGVTPLPMIVDGRRIRTAMTSSLSVDDRVADPMIGPRLLRDVRSGPHEAVLSDRSNEIAVSLSKSLKSHVFRDYSLDWFKVLRPGALAVDRIAERFGPFRLLQPLARPLDDRLLKRGAASPEPRWGVPFQMRGAHLYRDEAIGIEQVLDLLPRFLDAYPMRPDLSRESWRSIIVDSSRRSLVGAFHSRLVLNRDNEPVGLFLYNGRAGRIAEIVQILAVPGREGAVIDRALAHAVGIGAVAIRGRAQPALLDALIERRVAFGADLYTVVYSRDADVLRHFRQGTAFYTGIAGEHWMRINGDAFE